jgi:hypothetical protein
VEPRIAAALVERLHAIVAELLTTAPTAPLPDELRAALLRLLAR